MNEEHIKRKFGNLLNQIITNASFQKGAWNLLSEAALEQAQSGMEVTMC